MRVVILCGPSGAGKTTFVKTLSVPNAEGTGYTDVGVVSADSFFYETDGSYRFRADKLPAAHGLCLREFVLECQDGSAEVLVVDNTNTTLVEIAPYVSVANAYGHDVEIHVWVPRDRWAPSQKLWEVVLAGRNTHGVPKEAITQMLANLERTLGWWPRFWPRPIKHDLAE